MTDNGEQTKNKHSVEELLSILRTQNVIELKTKALTNLANLATEDVHREEILEQDGIQDIIKHLTEVSYPKTQIRASICILNLSVSNRAKILLRDAGVIDSLLTLVRNHDELSKAAEYAAGALNNLLQESTIQKYTANKDGLQTMVNLLKEVEPNEVETTQYTVGCISLLCIVPEVAQDFFVHHEGLNTLIKYINESQDQEVVSRATAALWNVAMTPKNRELFYGRQDVVEKLFELIKHEDLEIATNCLVTLGLLCINDTLCETIKSLPQSLETVVQLLQSTTDEEFRGFCLMFIGNMSQSDAEVRDRVRELEALPLIVDQLDSTIGDVLGKAVAALLILAVNRTNSEFFVHQTNTLEKLIPVLFMEHDDDPSDEALEIIRTGITALGIMAYYDENKERIISDLGHDALLQCVQRFVTQDPELEKHVIFGDTEVIDKLTCAILNLSTEQQVRDLFMEEGGLETLIHLLDHPDHDIRNNAAASLCNMALDPTIKSRIKNLNAFKKLLIIMQENLTDQANQKTVRRAIKKEKLIRKKLQTRTFTRPSVTPGTSTPSTVQEEPTSEESPIRRGPPVKKSIKMISDDDLLQLITQPVVTPSSTISIDSSSSTPQSTTSLTSSPLMINVNNITDEEELNQRFDKIQMRSMNSWVHSKMRTLLETAGQAKASMGRVLEKQTGYIPETDESEILPLAALQTGKRYPDWVDTNAREKYLSDDDFSLAFNGISRKEFASYPDWKRGNLKKAVGLF
ncbi:supervillin [Acrasis kona]|uniref:Supervillin n=1 Tax=Acrasis kona TaxID=1008807 RepID=A0AAW2ZHU3_9EUKA